jgi:rRNA maturation endonuclease Nob1
MRFFWNPGDDIVTCHVCKTQVKRTSRTQKYCRPCGEQTKKQAVADYQKRNKSK